MKEKEDYLLGVNQKELERLEFQQKVWKKVTNDFLDKIEIKESWKCLDVGAGPGFVSSEIRQRVGEKGEVTALEPSEFFLNVFRQYCDKMNYTNCVFINGKVEDTDLKKGYYDFIFIRWVIDFVSEPEKFLLKLTESLKKGGIIAVQDYAYTGITLFPGGGPFDRIKEIARNYYKAGGGDPDFTLRIPHIFRKNNIELKEFSPVCLAGGNESDVFEWAGKFFNGHLQLMADMKVINQKECDELLKDWLEHKENPETIFLSPVVMNVSGKKL